MNISNQESIDEIIKNVQIQNKLLKYKIFIGDGNNDIYIGDSYVKIRKDVIVAMKVYFNKGAL